ncbi:MAG TPA: EF-hand domain-containing protein [Polyangiaceae bacterium]|jgi:predicted ferric reductase/Ca2+-binding EF-hand superfamily protein
MADLSSSALSPADAELLRLLERAFAHHAGKDSRLDIDDLRRALGLRSEYLTRRIFGAFDRNGDGQISKHEFLAGVRALVMGSVREKLAFAFRLWDHDSDGFLTREELLRMISLSLAESDVEERVNQPAAQLASVLLSKADTNGDGRVSFEELVEAAAHYPDLLTRLTRSEAIWIAPNEELLLLLDERAGRPRQRSHGWLTRHAAQAAFLSVWLACNAAVLAWSLGFGRASQTSDWAMQLGRALGACLDLNVAFVFLPVMRRLLGWLRPRWLGRLLPVDDAIDFHKLVGHSLFALAWAHTAMFFVAYTRGHVAGPLGVLASARGLTGAVLLGVFALIWVFSLGFVRRSKRFELFYFTHLLYVLWLALLVAHAPRVLIFSGLALVAFLVEHLLRLRRRRPSSRVLTAMPLRSGVTHLEVERPAGFEFSPGDYVFLRIPKIARHEWHPFTISSAPEASPLGFHVRSLGNWSSALRRYVETPNQHVLTAYVDGPYGSPSARIFRSRFAVLIGAGIGVTPFASVLESAVLRSDEAKRSCLEKVHFFWLNSDQYSFEWFRGLLADLEQQDHRHLLEIHLCMTSMRSGVTAFGLELAREVMHDAGRSDFITGLRTKTHLGHPDWEDLLSSIAKRHHPFPVDVYYCGPRGLAKKLEPICHRFGMRFREERF